jgi:hypothetical protein
MFRIKKFNHPFPVRNACLPLRDHHGEIGSVIHRHSPVYYRMFLGARYVHVGRKDEGTIIQASLLLLCVHDLEIIRINIHVEIEIDEVVRLHKAIQYKRIVG